MKPADPSEWSGLEIMATTRMMVSVHDASSQPRRQVSCSPVASWGLLSDARGIQGRNHDRLRKIQAKYDGDNIINQPGSHTLSRQL